MALSKPSLRVAIIGQSQFAADVITALRDHGHEVAVVFTIPDKNEREDALATHAKTLGIPVHKLPRWRGPIAQGGKILPEVLALYTSYKVDINLLPYCSQFIPAEVTEFPTHHSLCYHPSILPRHRGASAISWTLIEGDTRAGLSVFWPDDGLDTGPVLLQEECDVEEDDTVDTLYRRFLYPAGVKALAKAVDIVAEMGVEKAPHMVQDETYASYDARLTKPQPINFGQETIKVHNFIRGLDSVPGASCIYQGEEAILSQSTICEHYNPELLMSMVDTGDARSVEIEGCTAAWLTEEGLMIQCSDKGLVNVKRVKLQGKVKLASKLFADTGDSVPVVFDDAELVLQTEMKNIWVNILSCPDIDDSSDFFACGGASMDVVRLVESTKELLDIQIENEHVFLNSSFGEYFEASILLKRKTSGDDGTTLEIPYEGFEMIANKIKIRCPTQLFINGRFVDATPDGKNPISENVFCPHDDSILCKVQCASKVDVDKAVRAAAKAFEGEWSLMSARERGKKLLKLADLMEQHKEELATLESLDSGAVYTLALKTHVGMSIETWRYYAGWCDKIQGDTIPISSARPNRNLCLTKREPIGVCALVTPWNYPLMMLSWKMAACLAAGNTVVIKPAMVTPLTALKFAELSVLAGIPAGVINVLPGSGTLAGACLAEHPMVRKLGFTGSTPVGKIIMKACASNLKKVSLELGGKSPLVIFHDSDMNKAVRVAMQSVFFNKGENCIAAGRIFVEASIHDEFVSRVIEETKKMVIGHPFDKKTSHGPQNHLAHLLKLEEYVQIGLKDGAELRLGGKRVDTPGYYFEPTVFTGVQDHMEIAKEESFGPIMCVSKFKNNDLDGVLKRANRTEYGLAAGVFTNDISKAMRFAEASHAGTVFVNTYNKTDVAAPFGGFKQSGFGKDLGAKAIEEYTITKTITLEY